MPAKLFNIARKVDKQILKFPLKIQDRIILALKDLKQNPLKGAVLGGELSDSHKLRVGDYRIIYKFNVKESRVDVVKIEHRQGVYK